MQENYWQGVPTQYASTNQNDVQKWWIRYYEKSSKRTHNIGFNINTKAKCQHHFSTTISDGISGIINQLTLFIVVCICEHNCIISIVLWWVCLEIFHLRSFKGEGENMTCNNVHVKSTLPYVGHAWLSKIETNMSKKYGHTNELSREVLVVYSYSYVYDHIWASYSKEGLQWNTFFVDFLNTNS